MLNYVLSEKGKKAFKKTDIPVFTEAEELKKFNLKLSSGDLDLISFIANKHGISKNKILDEIVNSIILDFLSNLDRNNYMLLVKMADLLNGVDTFSNIEASWISDLYPSSIRDDRMEHDLLNQKRDLTDLSPHAGIAGDDRDETYKHMLNSILASKLLEEHSKQVKGDQSE